MVYFKRMKNDYSGITIATYNKTADQYIVKVQNYAPQPERKKFISFVRRGGRILDAGCGSGRDSNFFASKRFIVTGIDLSDTLLAYAIQHTEENCTFQKMDLRSILFPVSSFDGIWACASLLHLAREEILPVLQTFYTILASGGMVYLQVKEGVGERMVTSGTIEGDRRFFTYYSCDKMKKLLNSAGFVVCDIYTWDQKDRNSERPSEIWISCFAQKI